MLTEKSNIHSALKKYFGFNKFKGLQEDVVESILSKTHTFVIMPTGGGKSLCYQLPALMQEGTAIVVSPLIALMKNQVDAIRGISSEHGIAHVLNSSLNKAEVKQVKEDITNGITKLLYVAPESLTKEEYVDFLKSQTISFVAVDEAHCISEWGHNFRPDYLKLPRYREELNIPLVLLLTATATKKVKRDMAERFAIDPKCIVQTGFYRANLDLNVLSVKTADKNTELTEIVRAQTGPGIVYVTLQQSAEQVANMLSAQGLQAVAYHAGLEDTLRGQIQDDFMAGKINVVVATIAFGMGVDKSDIRFVIHYDLPKSIENYSQEIGRAGRDGNPSNCYTLANLDGLNTVENFVYGDTPELSGIEYVIDTIKAETQTTHINQASQHESKWELQLISLSNASNIKQLPLKTLLVQLELMGVIEPMYAYFADFKIKLLQPIEQILAGFNHQRKAFLSTIFKATAFKKVWGSLNFETLLQDKSVERNRVIAALEYLHEQQMIVLETSGMTEVFKVNTHELNNPVLARNLTDYFLDKEEKEIKRIATLVRFFQLDGCLSYNLSRYFDDINAPIQCGHCSVCRGNIAQLQYSQQVPWPSDDMLIANVGVLSRHLEGKTQAPLTLESYCRFFAGLTMPLFGRNKVRQLTGFASCEQQRYQAIRDKLLQLGFS